MAQALFPVESAPTGLRTLLIYELQMLYDAESQIRRALPKLTESATHNKINQHFIEQQRHVVEHERHLSTVLKQIGDTSKRRGNKVMRVMLKDYSRRLDEVTLPHLKDSLLLLLAQHITQYRIASYRSTDVLAHMIGERDVARTLRQRWDGETVIDKTLAIIGNTTDLTRNER